MLQGKFLRNVRLGEVSQEGEVTLGQLILDNPSKPSGLVGLISSSVSLADPSKPKISSLQPNFPVPPKRTRLLQPWHCLGLRLVNTEYLSFPMGSSSPDDPVELAKASRPEWISGPHWEVSCPKLWLKSNGEWVVDLPLDSIAYCRLSMEDTEDERIEEPVTELLRGSDSILFSFPLSRASSKRSSKVTHFLVGGLGKRLGLIMSLWDIMMIFLVPVFCCELAWSNTYFNWVPHGARTIFYRFLWASPLQQKLRLWAKFVPVLRMTVALLTLPSTRLRGLYARPLLGALTEQASSAQLPQSSGQIFWGDQRLRSQALGYLRLSCRKVSYVTRKTGFLSDFKGFSAILSNRCLSSSPLAYINKHVQVKNIMYVWKQRTLSLVWTGTLPLYFTLIFGGRQLNLWYANKNRRKLGQNCGRRMRIEHCKYMI